jgi:hypothetical protein
VTAFEVVGFAFGALSLLWSAFAVIHLRPTFGKMFADFAGPLPGFTLLCLQPWFPILLGLAPWVVVGDSVMRGASTRGRAIRLGVTIFLTFALPGLFVVGIYLPIFSVAAAIE